MDQQSNRIMVAVWMVTYNQEDFIADAIESVMLQRTDFKVKLFIGEDCSTDNTRNICLYYKKKYPNEIRLLLNTINDLKQNSANAYDAVLNSGAKYIAMLEGDDYWTDPLKLQKQVDFLESNADCSLCFHATEHATEHVYGQHPEKNYVYRPRKIPKDSKFEMKHAILGGGGFMATNSMVFHREYINERPSWMDKSPVGDLPLMLLLASQGKIGYIDEVMGAYRIMTENSWSSSMRDKTKRRSHHYAISKMWDDFDEWTGYKYNSYVVRKKRKNVFYYLRGCLTNFVRKLFPRHN